MNRAAMAPADFQGLISVSCQQYPVARSLKNPAGKLPHGVFLFDEKNRVGAQTFLGKLKESVQTHNRNHLSAQVEKAFQEDGHARRTGERGKMDDAVNLLQRNGTDRFGELEG